MNIFVLHIDPWTAAHQQCDKHVVKMIVETTQILSTVSHRHGGTFVPYKPTHVGHPCVKWAGESYENWQWLVEHGLALSSEYENRYKKVHACYAHIERLALFGSQGDGAPSKSGMTPHAQAMPEQYKCADVVQAYRAYYIGEKARFAKWRYCDPPEWWPKSVGS